LHLDDAPLQKNKTVSSLYLTKVAVPEYPKCVEIDITAFSQTLWVAILEYLVVELLPISILLITTLGLVMTISLIATLSHIVIKLITLTLVLLLRLAFAIPLPLVPLVPLPSLLLLLQLQLQLLRLLRLLQLPWPVTIEHTGCIILAVQTNPCAVNRAHLTVVGERAVEIVARIAIGIRGRQGVPAVVVVRVVVIVVVGVGVGRVRSVGGVGGRIAGVVWTAVGRAIASAEGLSATVAVAAAPAVAMTEPVTLATDGAFT
jgi:hypothetical protein